MSATDAASRLAWVEVYEFPKKHPPGQELLAERAHQLSILANGRGHAWILRDPAAPGRVTLAVSAGGYPRDDRSLLQGVLTGARRYRFTVWELSALSPQGQGQNGER